MYATTYDRRTGIGGPTAWIGGEDVKRDGVYLWTHGRLKGQPYTQYLGPSNRQCLPISYKGVVTFSDCHGTWGANQPDRSGPYNSLWTGVNPAMHLDDAVEQLTNCFVCERSPCGPSIDCYGPNTEAAAGYYPHCSCRCKPWAWGDRCEYPYRHTHTAESGGGGPSVPFASDYLRLCGADAQAGDTNETRTDGDRLAKSMSWATAAARCAALTARGVGEDQNMSSSGQWRLATFPSSATLSSFALYSADPLALGADKHISRGGNGAWIGAIENSATPGVWQWSHGRLAPQQFRAQSGAAVAAKYHTFEGAPPDNVATFAHTGLWAAGRPLGGGRKCARVAPSGASPTARFEVQDVACGTDATAEALPPSDDAFTACLVCERSPCRMGTDCYEPNTASIDGGYWPACRCVCKEGAYGDKCEWPVTVAHGNAYVSEYAAVCDGTLRPIGAAAAACGGLRDRAGAGGFDVATFPSSAALGAFTARLRLHERGGNTWVAASDAAVEGQWRWTAGRLAGALFNTVVVTPHEGDNVPRAAVLFAGPPSAAAVRAVGCG